jgi:hypothetical protein
MGWLVVRIKRTAVRSGCGQFSGLPREDRDQSWLRINVAISLSPDRKSTEPAAWFFSETVAVCRKVNLIEPESRDGNPFETSGGASDERHAEVLITSILRSFWSRVF